MGRSKYNILHLLVTMVLLGLLGQQSVFAASNIHWQKYNKKIFSQSKEKKTPILLFVKADWCPHCHKMRETTLQADPVIKMINESFIPVMIDADNHRKLAQEYRVTGLPAFLVINNDKKVIADFSGEWSITAFMQKLKKAHKDFRKTIQ